MTKFTTQFAYLEALKRAMVGLPDDVYTATIADYQQRFLDGLSAGRNEAEIAAELDEPKIIAARLRNSSAVVAFQEKKSPTNFARMFFSFVGLLVFNVFLIIPAFVYGAMMLCLYGAAIVAYVVGIAVTSSSLAGVNELVFDGPMRHVVVQKHQGADTESTEVRGKVNVEIGSTGVRITPEIGPLDEDVGRGTVIIGSGDAGIGEDSRSTGAIKGVGLILSGILLILLSMVMTRYTWLGIKRYAQMNVSLLRGN